MAAEATVVSQYLTLWSHFHHPIKQISPYRQQSRTVLLCWWDLMANWVRRVVSKIRT